MDVFLNQFLFKCFINEIKIFLIFNTKKMRISNTNYKNISYDKARGRYRIEMRIGKLPRTARVKDLQSAILIRDEWLIERNHLNAELAAEKIKLNL